MKKRCHCIISHANTPKEREEVTKRMAYFERIKDKQGIQICQLRLANGDCPARPKEEPK